jgi:alpha-tubulin suppressor-like RCC1 family protein
MEHNLPSKMTILPSPLLAIVLSYTPEIVADYNIQLEPIFQDWNSLFFIVTGHHNITTFCYPPINKFNPEQKSNYDIHLTSLYNYITKYDRKTAQITSDAEFVIKDKDVYFRGDYKVFDKDYFHVEDEKNYAYIPFTKTGISNIRSIVGVGENVVMLTYNGEVLITDSEADELEPVIYTVNKNDLELMHIEVRTIPISNVIQIVECEQEILMLTSTRQLFRYRLEKLVCIANDVVFFSCLATGLVIIKTDGSLWKDVIECDFTLLHKGPFVSVATGCDHLLALTNEGKIIFVGDNKYHQLPSKKSVVRLKDPVIFIERIVAISSGYFSSNIIFETGNIIQYPQGNIYNRHISKLYSGVITSFEIGRGSIVLINDSCYDLTNSKDNLVVHHLLLVELISYPCTGQLPFLFLAR